MRGVKGFDPGRGRPSRFVKMNAHENALLLIVCDRRPVLERNVTVVRAREQSRQTALFQLPLQAMRDIQRQLLFHHAGFYRPGIQAAVARIDHDKRELRGFVGVSGRRVPTVDSRE